MINIARVKEPQITVSFRTQCEHEKYLRTSSRSATLNKGSLTDISSVQRSDLGPIQMIINSINHDSCWTVPSQARVINVSMLSLVRCVASALNGVLERVLDM